MATSVSDLGRSFLETLVEDCFDVFFGGGDGDVIYDSS